MRKALVATYLFAMLCFGLIIGSAVSENGMTGFWVLLLILDIVIGIALQRKVDEEGCGTSPSPTQPSKDASRAPLSKEKQELLKELLLADLKETVEKHQSENEPVDLMKRFDELYSALGLGNAKLVNGMDEDEHGCFLKSVCRQMPYAPPARWLRGLNWIAAERWAETPILIYAFENEHFVICQNVFVCLARTENEIRFLNVEVGMNALILCEFRNGSHFNYGEVDLKELPDRIKALLRGEQEETLPF